MNVSKSVQSVLNLYEGRIRQAGIEVIFEKRDCPPLTALGDKIKQVLVNLVGNAVDAMKRGGFSRSGFGPHSIRRLGRGAPESP